ncbi:hypothetical protein C8Q75DRAFT_317045 [Abortiporus biennis]|nr:hypothetical protein C8Q75DRAFT_317045 [Abortiporus biennis]
MDDATLTAMNKKAMRLAGVWSNKQFPRPHPVYFHNVTARQTVLARMRADRPRQYITATNATKAADVSDDHKAVGRLSATTRAPQVSKDSEGKDVTMDTDDSNLSTPNIENLRIGSPVPAAPSSAVDTTSAEASLPMITVTEHIVDDLFNNLDATNNNVDDMKLSSVQVQQPKLDTLSSDRTLDTNTTLSRSVSETSDSPDPVELGLFDFSTWDSSGDDVLSPFPARSEQPYPTKISKPSFNVFDAESGPSKQSTPSLKRKPRLSDSSLPPIASSSKVRLDDKQENTLFPSSNQINDRPHKKRKKDLGSFGEASVAVLNDDTQDSSHVSNDVGQQPNALEQRQNQQPSDITPANAFPLPRTKKSNGKQRVSEKQAADRGMQSLLSEHQLSKLIIL